MSDRPASGDRIAVLLAAMVLMASGPLHAGMGKRQDGIRYDRLPEWVRTAAERTAPSTQAAIAWLHEERSVEPLAEGGVRVVQRRAGKLLDLSGREKLAVQSFEYSKDDRDAVIRGWTVLPDGTAKKILEERSAGDISDAPYTSSGVDYEDTRVMSAYAPGVVVGAVVAHEYSYVQDLDFGGDGFWFGTLDEPTVLSRFTLRVPDGWTVESSVCRGESLEKEESNGTLSYTAANLERLPWEELRPSYRELLPAVWVRWRSPDGSRGMADWDAVARWHAGLGEPVLEDAGESADLGKAMAPADADHFLESVAAAFEFAARSIRYVAVYLGIDGWKPHSPAEVHASRYGDCKDKTYLLRSLVREWGVASYAVLVRTKRQGPLLEDNPFAAGFDHVIAAVALPDGVGSDLWPVLEVEGIGRLLFLDATVGNGDPWNLRPDVQGTTALLVHPGGGKLIELPSQPPEAEKRTLRLEASVGASGFLEEAVLTETYTGVAAMRARDEYAALDDGTRKQAMESRVQGSFPGTTLAGRGMTGLDDANAPVVTTYRMHGGKLGKRVSSLLILEPGRCARGVAYASLPPPPRKWDLRFMAPNMEEVEIRIRIPEGWQPEKLPAPMAIDTAEFTAHSDWLMEDGALVYRRTAALLEDTIPPDRYESFRDAVRKANREASQGVVFIKGN